MFRRYWRVFCRYVLEAVRPEAIALATVADQTPVSSVRHSPVVARLSAVWDSESSLAGSPATQHQVSVLVEQAQANSSSGDTAGPDLDQVPTAYSTLAGVVPLEAAEPAVSLLPLLLYVCCS